jgi:two-component system phosphate regulon sensor histidine kinase PhoR
LGQLESIARLAKARPPKLSSVPPASAEDRTALDQWVTQMAASNVRVTVITADGQVLADSQSDPRTMENHANRPEVRDALTKGEGQSARRSVTVSTELLYYAVRYDAAPGVPVVLRFAAPLATVHETLVAFRRKLWFASVIIMLLAGTASLLVSRGFSDRIERLKEFSRRVAEGDFRPLPGDGSGDALEKLGASLNQTALRLDRTIRTLTEERNLSSAILGSMVEGVAVVSGAERLVFANQSFAGILDLDLPPKSGSALVEVVRQTDLIEAVRKVLAGELYASISLPPRSARYAREKHTAP